MKHSLSRIHNFFTAGNLASPIWLANYYCHILKLVLQVNFIHLACSSYGGKDRNRKLLSGTQPYQDQDIFPNNPLNVLLWEPSLLKFCPTFTRKMKSKVWNKRNYSIFWLYRITSMVFIEDSSVLYVYVQSTIKFPKQFFIRTTPGMVTVGSRNQ